MAFSLSGFKFPQTSIGTTIKTYVAVSIRVCSQLLRERGRHTQQQDQVCHCCRLRIGTILRWKPFCGRSQERAECTSSITPYDEQLRSKHTSLQPGARCTHPFKQYSIAQAMKYFPAGFVHQESLSAVHMDWQLVCKMLGLTDKCSLH